VDPHGFAGYTGDDQAIFIPLLIANCFNAGHLKMEMEVPVSGCLKDS
nr:hypothetical protein [Tanacetum cinerariifolium]